MVVGLDGSSWGGWGFSVNKYYAGGKLGHPGLKLGMCRGSNCVDNWLAIEWR
jgi:hypothetical protein